MNSRLAVLPLRELELEQHGAHSIISNCVNRNGFNGRLNRVIHSRCGLEGFCDLVHTLNSRKCHHDPLFHGASLYGIRHSRPAHARERS